MTDVRLFIGVRLSLASVEALAGARDSLARAADDAGLPVKWVAPASYHVTLKFLGWCREEVVEALRDRLGVALAGQTGFEITCRGVGAFGKPDKARVIWAGIEDGGALARLAEPIEAACVELGFQPDKRAFHPHVTLGRLRKLADVSELLVPCAEQNFSETSVESVILFESVMKSSGSEYHERAAWALESSSKSRKRQTGGLDPSLTGES